MSNEVIQHVINYSKTAHKAQLRKYTNDPYIRHPISVARMVSNLQGSLEMVLASILHDVIEDTHISSDELFEFLDTTEGITHKEAIKTHNMVVELTDVYTKKNYPHLNRKARKELEATRLGNISEEAKIIKKCDIHDNKISIMQHDPGFYKVFAEETSKALECMGYNDKVSFDINMMQPVREILNVQHNQPNQKKFPAAS